MASNEKSRSSFFQRLWCGGGGGSFNNSETIGKSKSLRSTVQVDIEREMLSLGFDRAWRMEGTFGRMGQRVPSGGNCLRDSIGYGIASILQV